MYLEALALSVHTLSHPIIHFHFLRLNRWLRESKSKTTVIAFLIMNAKTTNYNVDALRGHAVNKLLACVIGP